MPGAGRDYQPTVATHPSRYIALRQQLALIAFRLRLPSGADDLAVVERASEVLGISARAPLSERAAACYDALYSARPSPLPPDRLLGHEPSGGAQPGEPRGGRRTARPRLELRLRHDLALEGIQLIQMGCTPRDVHCPWPDGPGEPRRQAPPSARPTSGARSLTSSSAPRTPELRRTRNGRHSRSLSHS
jgi:hypothetical protein